MTISFRVAVLGAATGCVALGAQAADHLLRRAPPPLLPLSPVFT